jgi:hypothetical protein
MMAERLPTIYHGVAGSEEDKRIVDDAIQDITARFNEVPGDLALRVICSLVTSVCCAQDDPAETFTTIGHNVGLAIEAATAEPEGNG